MKMAASFHQRVVVGEEMSANQSKDFNPNSISTAAHKSIHAQYQGKTREVIPINASFQKEFYFLMIIFLFVYYYRNWSELSRIVIKRYKI